MVIDTEINLATFEALTNKGAKLQLFATQLRSKAYVEIEGLGVETAKFDYQFLVVGYLALGFALAGHGVYHGCLVFSERALGATV